MNRGLNEILEPTPSTDELMDVDTSFLDAYRRSGTQQLERTQQRTRQSDTPARTIGTTRIELDAGGSGGVDAHHEVETRLPGPGGALGAGEDVVPGLEPDSRSTEHSGRQGQHGGGEPTSTAPSGEMMPGSSPGGAVTDADFQARQEDGADLDEVTLDEVTLDEDAVTASMRTRAASGESTPISLELTNHQESVQSGAASARGGTAGPEDGAALPQSGFKLSGVKSQPAVRALPGIVVSTLREQLRSAAVQDLGVNDATARVFSERLSQVSLVTAFLLAQLDLGLEADASTRLAAKLFRSRNPLLSSLAARLDGLETLEVQRTTLLGALREELAEVRQTAAVVEQAVAYSIADRTENFLRGSHNIHDAPITHKAAIFLRDRAREATKKQTRLEREREGRPIR
ncbi:hypothetical protein L3Q67_26395 [Saccharothrix sp. AJ9571]|nr:hypothetical protein L3Q67_26395 [Saccharothrix sp. AJ9571]